LECCQHPQKQRKVFGQLSSRGNEGDLIREKRGGEEKQLRVRGGFTIQLGLERNRLLVASTTRIHKKREDTSGLGRRGEGNRVSKKVGKSKRKKNGNIGGETFGGGGEVYPISTKSCFKNQASLSTTGQVRMGGSREKKQRLNDGVGI